MRDYRLHLVTRGLKAGIGPIVGALRFFYGTTLATTNWPRRSRCRRGRSTARRPHPGPGQTLADRRARPADADALHHGLRRRAARLRGRRASGRRHLQRPHGHPRPPGQGGKDRYVMLSPQLLAILRGYWGRTRPPPGCSRGRPRPARSRRARCSAPAARRPMPPGSTSR